MAIIIIIILQLVLCTSIKHKNMLLHPRHAFSSELDTTLHNEYA